MWEREAAQLVTREGAVILLLIGWSKERHKQKIADIVNGHELHVDYILKNEVTIDAVDMQYIYPGCLVKW